MGYEMEPADLGVVWDRFVQSSAEGTVFSLTSMVENIGLTAEPYYCVLGNRVVAAILTFRGAAGEFAWSDFLVYGGVLFAPADVKQNFAQVNSDQLKVNQFIAAWLTTEFPAFSFPGSPAFRDWRPFLWKNHGLAENCINLELRYTSIVDLKLSSDPVSATDLKSNPFAPGLAKSRRQIVRYSLSDGIEVSRSSDVDLLIRGVRQSYARQGLKLAGGHISTLRAVSESLLSAKAAELVVSTDSGGNPLSVAMIGFDRKRAYYLFGGSMSDGRSETAGSALIWNIINDLANRGIQEFDLEGVNSPARGYFKMSFGGSLVPYHRVTYFPASPN